MPSVSLLPGKSSLNFKEKEVSEAEGKSICSYLLTPSSTLHPRPCPHPTPTGQEECSEEASLSLVGGRFHLRKYHSESPGGTSGLSMATLTC